MPQGGPWSQAEESSLRVGVAEMRRREDVYLGFCIAALVGCCEPGTSSQHTSSSGAINVNNANNASNGANQGVNSVSRAADREAEAPVGSLGSAAGVPVEVPVSRRASYVIQLQAVVSGKGAKSQRRLTTRSRLRAAYALLLLLNTTSSNSSGTSRQIRGAGESCPSDSDPNGFQHLYTHISPEVPLLVPFLFCLAELQETRLPCSEEALMEALTHLPPSSQGHSNGATLARTDARLLVRTWLHDEGCHREVPHLPFPLATLTSIV